MYLSLSDKVLIENIEDWSVYLIMCQVHELLYSVSKISINCRDFWFNFLFLSFCWCSDMGSISALSEDLDSALELKSSFPTSQNFLMSWLLLLISQGTKIIDLAADLFFPWLFSQSSVFSPSLYMLFVSCIFLSSLIPVFLSFFLIKKEETEN